MKFIDTLFSKAADLIIYFLLAGVLAALMYSGFRYDVEVAKQGATEAIHVNSSVITIDSVGGNTITVIQGQ